MTKLKIDITPFSGESDSLSHVIALWRKHSDTLGFFPEGAFLEYAAKRQIITAHDDEELAGYLLYRISKNRVSIAHLCIDPNYRGKNLSCLLIDVLRKETLGLRGVGLYCRRDFSVSSLWPKLGFVAVNEKKGRGKSKETLTYWWLDYGNPTLFSEPIARDIESKFSVVMDANIFYDLDPRNKKIESIESKALDADWFRGEAVILLTDEIYNEINRRECENERDHQRRRAVNFDFIMSDKVDATSIETKLKHSFNPKSLQDYSDIRQLSHAISGQANYFITRDDYILGKSDFLYEKYGINVKRPAEIILEIDSLYDEVSYRPARLAGTHATLRLVIGSDIKRIVKQFCLHKQSEKLKSFEKRIASTVGQTDKYRIYVADDISGQALAIYAIESTDNGNLHIPLARVKEGALASTLARYILAKLTRIAMDEGKTSITFSDLFLQPIFTPALEDEGFILSNGTWVKLVTIGVMTASSIERRIKNNELPIPSSVNKDEIEQTILDMLHQISPDNLPHTLYTLERFFWPGKVVDNNGSCYIVPIKPGWARELFDEGLANQDLFGVSKLDLAIQNEGVYYYSSKGAKTSAPARIMWYVSKDGKIHESGAIRACSIIKNVSIDNPKTLYKRYRRLGVYNWNDVYKTAKNDINNNVTAIHFGHTELFKSPITFEDLQPMLLGLKINKNIISATPVPIDVFLKMYKKGMNIHA